MQGFYGPGWEVACVRAKSLQLCPTLSDPMDSGPPGSSVQGILQARILEWVAISFLRGSEFEQTPGDNGRQRNLACCTP